MLTLPENNIKAFCQMSAKAGNKSCLQGNQYGFNENVGAFHGRRCYQENKLK